MLSLSEGSVSGRRSRADKWEPESEAAIKQIIFSRIRELKNFMVIHVQENKLRIKRILRIL